MIAEGFYSNNRIVGEYKAGGNADVKAEYIWLLPEVGASGPTGGDDGTGGYMPLAIAKGTTGALNWVHSHHNAKPIMLTDSTGATVAYSGHAVLGFPGQFANAVGLAGAQYYYNYYRDYDDTTGRYIQADPIGLAGDANPYAYAMGNALRYSDPLGLVVYRVGVAADLTFGVGVGGGAYFAFSIEPNGTIEAGLVFEISGRAGLSGSAGLQANVNCPGSVSSQTGLSWDGTGRLGPVSLKAGGPITRRGAEPFSTIGVRAPINSGPRLSVGPQLGIGASSGVNAKLGIPILRIAGSRPRR